jgi:hypothetical protein
MIALKLHPDSLCDAVTGVGVEATRSDSGLALRFLATGSLDGLVLPTPSEPRRADGLWRQTCFEAFIAGPDGEAYVELNFSPSTEWAAYRFDAYREGMAPAELAPLRIETQSTDEGFELRAVIDLEPAGFLPVDGPWRLGLSAVIETVEGVSHWALEHPPGRADFHHPDCFAVQLPAPGRP